MSGHSISMRRMSSPAPLPALTANAREQLLCSWQDMLGFPPGDLDHDVGALADIFDPRLDAMQLLRRLESVRSSPDPPEELVIVQPPLIIRIGTRTIVTPDGRLALQGIGAADASEPYACVLAAYREWCQAPLLEFAEDVAGRGKRMTSLALGFLLIVLACDAVGHAKALVATSTTIEPMRAALRPALVVLNARLAGGSGGNQAPRFDDYPLSKARRRMGGDLRREPDRGLPFKVWLEPAARGRALQVVAYELAVQRELGIDEALSMVDDGFRALDEQREGLSKLALALADPSVLRAELSAALVTVTR